MCYWRRLSKRSVDEFDYEYTTNTSSLANSKKRKNSANEDDEPVISDSLNLFKALQVRHESEPSKASQQQMGSRGFRELYEEDEEASLICYGHMEVYVFLATIASLLSLVVTIAVVCCLRVRKLTRAGAHQRMLANPSSASSLSPSLLSISDAGSILSKQYQKGHPTTICHFNQPKPITQISYYHN